MLISRFLCAIKIKSLNVFPYLRSRQRSVPAFRLRGKQEGLEVSRDSAPANKYPRRFCAHNSQDSESLVISWEWKQLLKSQVMFCGGDLVEEDLDSKLEELMLLLPEAAHCIDQMEPFVVARLMSDLPHVFGRLMELKRCFPESDISRMVLRTQLWLLADDADMSEVIQVASEFRTQFPSSDIDRLLESFPWLLNLNDHTHHRVDMVQLQRVFFEDHIGSELQRNHQLTGTTLSEILAYKQHLVESLSASDVTDYNRIVTKSNYMGGFRMQ
mmetsp:Transcript_14587/g.28040  ORF Transcript_14587/g.28040 Transcript_14587/m.28040 type:complete len:271 (-) Transcript_14587:358-1170(-)